MVVYNRLHRMIWYKVSQICTRHTYRTVSILFQELRDRFNIVSMAAVLQNVRLVIQLLGQWAAQKRVFCPTSIQGRRTPVVHISGCSLKSELFPYYLFTNLHSHLVNVDANLPKN